jgi:hypothetical protein
MLDLYRTNLPWMLYLKRKQSMACYKIILLPAELGDLFKRNFHSLYDTLQKWLKLQQLLEKFLLDNVT